MQKIKIVTILIWYLQVKLKKKLKYSHTFMNVRWILKIYQILIKYYNEASYFFVEKKLTSIKLSLLFVYQITIYFKIGLHKQAIY